MTAAPTETAPVFLSRNGKADAHWAMGSLFEMVLPGEATRGALTAMRVTQPPGIATPLHIHHREAEVFYLLAGTLDYEAGGDVQRMHAGDLIWLPPGVPHRFRIRGESPAEILALGVPGGLDGLYAAVGRPAAERRIPDAYPAEDELDRWRTAAGEHGLEVIGPPLPE